jgi:hypothetical protein
LLGLALSFIYLLFIHPGNSIGIDGARALALYLPRYKSIVSLILEQNEIGDEGAQVLGRSLPACSSLKSLNVARESNSDYSISI